MRSIDVETISYGGWKNCVLISNGMAELVVTADVGPRIIRYGFVGGENELREIESERGLTGGDLWRMYGGHRLWHSPEDKKRTYEPDNGPVSWEEVPGGIKTDQKLEPRSCIGKEMEIVLSSKGSRVAVLHRLTNAGLWPVELSVWSITVMASGGKEVVPQSRRDTGLLPNRVVALWPYSRLDDPRVRWGARYITLRQDPSIEAPFKFGISNEEGWAAYFNRGRLFVKRYRHVRNALYPDFGVSYESYTNDSIIELETLSPLARLVPGASVEHREEWELFESIPLPPDDESEIDAALESAITKPFNR